MIHELFSLCDPTRTRILELAIFVCRVYHHHLLFTITKGYFGNEFSVVDANKIKFFVKCMSIFFSVQHKNSTAKSVIFNSF